jgi:hypothetical protein
MKASLLLVAGALTFVAVAAPASAGTDPLLEIIYENISSLSACLSGTTSLSLSVTIESGIPPEVTLGGDPLVPPSPECLVLPA